jgi:hypothetical protein
MVHVVAADIGDMLSCPPKTERREELGRQGRGDDFGEGMGENGLGFGTGDGVSVDVVPTYICPTLTIFCRR